MLKKLLEHHGEDALLTELEKQISEKLSGEEKDLFLKYTDKYIEFTARSLTDAFVSGFRLGAKFTHDTFI